MTQPHYIDREAVGVLIAKLRAVESSREPSDWSGIRQVTTNWYRNPDGPDAADMIEALFSRPPMEAVAWRWRYAGTNWYLGDVEPRRGADYQYPTEVQALAVIPTEGLGSSSPKSEDTHRGPTNQQLSHSDRGQK